MKHEKRHHSHKHHHHHHKSSETSVDWKKRVLRHDGKTYLFESYSRGLTPCYWRRLGRHGHQHSVSMTWQMEALDRVLEDQERKRIEIVQKTVLAMEKARDEEARDSDSASEDKPTPWQKHTQQGPPKKGERVERTKHGIRAYSSDGRTWWDFCVNNSTTYPGGTAVRLTLPPPRKDGKRWHMAVFDVETMEAIRREFDRGNKPDHRKRP